MTSEDESLALLKSTTEKGWPEKKSKTPSLIAHFHDIGDELDIIEGLAFREMTLVISKSMHTQIKKDFHTEHLGI